MHRRNMYRREPWAYHEPERSSTYFRGVNTIEDIGPEEDYAMDEFDKQLLAEHSNENGWEVQQVPGRYSLPTPSTTAELVGGSNWSLKHDLQDVRYPLYSSSPPLTTVSSPTVSVLQNRAQSSQRLKRLASASSSKHISTTPKDDAVSSSPWSSSKLVTTPFDLLRAPPIIQGISLVPTSHLPDHLRSVFKFELFNAVQSKCFSAAFETNDNMVLSAPTGSGKTVIMELALCRLIFASKNQDFKVIYQAPTKSLCSERCRDWRTKFTTLGLQCAELTGDVEYSQLKTVQSAQIIVTTPEKWDSVTRKWKDNTKLMQMIKLFLIDEVHILNESRGATLEAVVSRMKLAGSSVRFIALSATVPNSEDIAMWLGRDSISQHLPAYREVFDEAFRPVKLEKHVIGYKCKPNDFALDSVLTKEIPTIIARHAKRKPVMIFCVTKNSAAKTANALAELWQSTVAHLRLWNAPKKHFNVGNQDLQKLLQTGVAFHHGGLDVADRQVIEQRFLDGDINIVCSTSTLAVGVNLPCYLVILKGTSCWSDNGLQEYSSLDVMQMLGRAGRPQYETSACAIILTHSDKVRHYEEMVTGQETLESRLHQNLIEHLNAEIGTGTIHDRESAKRWLASSFLSVRLRQNPGYYNLENGTATKDAEELLERICHRDLELLEVGQLINGHSLLRCTPYGEAMSRYYVKYETMLAFLELPPKPKISEVLNFLTRAGEFSLLKLRSGEKAMYKLLNQANDIRYPIKVDIALPIHKTSLLIQSQLGGVYPDKTNVKYTPQFKQDSMMVMSHCNRLIRCMIDMQVHRKDSVAVKNALELCRSLAAGVWDNTPMQLKQIESVGDVTARKLAAAGVKDLDTFLNTEPHRVEMILGKRQPFGSTLLKKASKFPNLRVSVKEVGRTQKTASANVELQLKCEVGYLNDLLPDFFNNRSVNVCFLCETVCGKVLDFRRFGAYRLKNGEEILLTVSLDRPCQSINCHVMCDEIAGTHRYAELKLDIPKAWFPMRNSLYQVMISANAESLAGTSRSDDFNDDGVADDDFLAAEMALENVDLIEGNIDDIIRSSNTQISGHGIKRKAMTAHGDAPLVQVRGYRESKQLPNSNWTCQHTCKEDGKECKHHCCSEGVKKPKKRTKTQASEFNSANTIKHAFEKACTDNSNSRKYSIRDIDEVLQKSEKYRNKRNESIGMSRQVGESTVVRSTATTGNTGNNIIDIDEIGSDDLPSVKKIVSRPFDDSTASDVHDCNTSTEAELKKNFDFEDIDLDFEACDWTSVKKTLPRSSCGQEDRVMNWEIPYSHGCRSIGDENSPRNGARLHDRKTYASNSLFVSPEKVALEVSNTPPNSTMVGTFNDELDYFAEVDDGDLAALGEGSLLTPGAAKKDVTFQREVSFPGEAYQQTWELGKVDTLQTKIPSKDEEAQQQQQRHEESQREKWAKFPSWMFEQFGAYIDII